MLYLLRLALSLSQKMAVSEASGSASVQCVSRAALLMWFITGALVGRVSIWDPFVFFCACRAPRAFIPLIVIAGVFFFPDASLGIFVVGVKPVWNLCNEVSCVFDSRGLRGVKKTEPTKKGGTFTYVF